MVHVAETFEGEQEVLKKYGKSSIKVLDEFQLLNEKTLIAHATFTHDDDLRLIKLREASVVCCPTSNIVISGSILNIKKILSHKINCCIGTDGIVTGATFDLLREAHFAYIYNRVNQVYKNIVGTQEILDMITINAARALGMEKELGSIEIGKKADLLFIEGQTLLTKAQDIPYSLIFHEDGRSVFGVMIDGELKLWNRLLVGTSKSEKSIIDKYSRLFR